MLMRTGQSEIFRITGVELGITLILNSNRWDKEAGNDENI